MALGNRFWDKALKSDSCWLWQSALNEHGYGMFSVEGNQP